MPAASCRARTTCNDAATWKAEGCDGRGLPLRNAVTVTRRHAGGVLLAVMALTLTACGEGAVEAEPSVTAADLVHVHGLAERPDGLYVATHTGLFEVVGDRIRRVTDATHDLMGFTVAGPGDLLASGHPDPGVPSLQVEGKPPLLGLVRSSDGETWESLSLLGEADFHSLEAAHGRVYGFDGTTGRFMVTEDRTNWDIRGDGIGIIDFAVSPEDPHVIVATGQGGVGRSNDGGQTWALVADTEFTFLSWDNGELYAVAPDGQVAVSTDDGATWEARGALEGRPEALHARDGALYMALAEQGILRSADGGRTFEVLVDTSSE